MSGGEGTSAVKKAVAPARSAGRRRIARWPVAVLAAALLGFALVRAGATASPGPPLPPSAPVVEVTAREYRYDYKKPTRAGRTLFRVTNAGHVGHRFGVAVLPDDMPPIDEQLKGSVRRTIDFLADVPQVREEIAPGASLAVSIDLRPGQRYAFLCFLSTPDDKTHAELGMNTEFRVAGPVNPAPPAPTVASTATSATTAKPPGP